jgi:radical SAM peptide maturase (CXXX-repeat target family)/CXXX repeat peptide maturase
MKVKMGQLPEGWMEGKSKSITFCVTEDCNLACKYCYMTGKNNKTKMNFETGRQAVDYILTSKDREFDYDAVVWEFIGGEPFLEITLIDKISDYIKIRMFELNHKWFDCYRFSFSSNGLLYSSPKVQNYIEKNRGHISIGLSIDGNKIKHDLQRVKSDGSGSYDEVIKNAKLWMKQFPDSTTKATFAHDDLPYLVDSIISLWDLGLKMVPANVVFEDVWHEGDDTIFENQLKVLADYIIDNKLWEEHSVRFFDPRNGFPVTEQELEQNFCGSGRMLAIDCKGDLFPCIRFYAMSLENRPPISIGNIKYGINMDKVRPFELLTYRAQSTDECINCQVATGCAWCTGGNYDTADTDTIYQRATFICKMHKANMRANEYFWNKLKDVLGYMPEERQIYIDELGKKNKNYLIFITSDAITPHCSYKTNPDSGRKMNIEIMRKGLGFAKSNEYIPVFLGDNESMNHLRIESDFYRIIDGNTANDFKESIPVFQNDVNESELLFENSILLIKRVNLSKIAELCQKLFIKTHRINLKFEDIETWNNDDLQIYEHQLDILISLIIQSYKEQKNLQINVLNDLMESDSLVDCGAGETTFALAPNGKIYYCPAFYFDNPENSIGDLENGINIKNSYLLDHKRAPLCSICDAFHCSRCKFINKKCTNEINTPSKMQCVISHTERNKAMKLQNELKTKFGCEFKNHINEIDYLDPLDKMLKTKVDKGICI